MVQSEKKPEHTQFTWEHWYWEWITASGLHKEFILVLQVVS